MHGHSYKVELFLSATKLDRGGMVVDFTILKEIMHNVIEPFDHCHLIWDKDIVAYRDAIKTFNARWIELPVNPSAEQISRVIFALTKEHINSYNFENGEEFNVFKVRVHETDTGYAECSSCDLDGKTIPQFLLSSIKYSPRLIEEYNV
jgi:6-pyruvoyltetrahydropterin/6-carboxytetrahydropterin synthase